MKAFIVLCFVALSSASAFGENSEILWVLPVARLCVAQNPAYQQTLLGRWVMEGRLKFKSPEFDSCARQRNWIPQPMCEQVMSLNSEEAFSERNLGRLRTSHGSEFQRLSIAGEYVEAFERAEDRGAAVPACPQEAAIRPRSQRSDIFAGSNDANLNAMAEPIRNIYRWRLTPSVLLQRCAKEMPDNEPSMRAANDSWRKTNAPLISMIDRVVDRVVPLYASALAVSDAEAKNRMTAFTGAMIADSYLKNDQGAGSRGCADYEKIIGGLSSRGYADTTRGFVYAVEAMLTARSPRSASQPASNQGSVPDSQ